MLKKILIVIGLLVLVWVLNGLILRFTGLTGFAADLATGILFGVIVFLIIFALSRSKKDKS